MIISQLSSMIWGDSMRAKGIRSTFFTMAGFGTQAFLRLGSNIILTRLLAPEMFGLMALAFVFLQALTFMSDVGTHHSVMRSSRGEDPDFLRTAWTVQALRGIGIAICACLLAWPASQAYGEPELFVLLCVLSSTALIGGFVSISKGTASRNMEIGRWTGVMIASQVIAIIVMIAAAWYLASVWALAIGAIVGQVMQVSLSHLVLTRFKHRLRFERAALGELISYGRWVLFSSMFMFLGGQGITAVHGLLVPLQTLGILAISTQLVRALEDVVNQLLTNVGFPALAKTLREAPERLPEVLRKVRTTLLLASMAGFLLLAALAQPLIDLLYDERYTQSGVFLGILALNGGLRILCLPYQTVILAQGDSRTHAAVMFISAALGIACTVVGFYLYDAVGMVLGLGVAALTTFVMSAYFARAKGFLEWRFDLATLVVMGMGYWLFLSQVSV